MRSSSVGGKESRESFCTVETEPCNNSVISTETEYMEMESYLNLNSSTLALPSFLSRNTSAVAESLSVMLQKEQSFYRCQDYLKIRRTSSSAAHQIVTPSDRTKVVEWCYGIIDQCQLGREVVAIAMNIVDRFFSSNGSIDSVTQQFLDHEQYQLLAMTALYMSIKIHESTVLGSEFFAEISKGKYSVEQIETTELMILKQLEFRLSSPTPIQMATHILSLLLPYVCISQSTWDFILEEVKYQSECTVFDYFFSTQRPSTVAMASIMITVELEQVLEEQGRKALLKALALISAAHDFANPTQLLDVKNQLQYLVYNGI